MAGAESDASQGTSGGDAYSSLQEDISSHDFIQAATTAHVLWAQVKGYPFWPVSHLNLPGLHRGKIHHGSNFIHLYILH